ncbi:hypothetical protein [Phenylobacterium sp.]|jgi:DNA-binding Lrp family transcriptional regulator|uniref:hypothetical protein n=1 Tax=Phenylobacterium sp. TaxID=1871053 RepID=UPI002F924D74
MRTPPLRPKTQRLVACAAMRGQSTEAVAARLGWSVRAVGQQLSELRARGLARWAHVVCPERLGNSICLLSYVSLRSVEPADTDAFEDWCREDTFVTQAVLLAGRWDYALWSWHRDTRSASNWLRLVESRAEVGRCDTRVVRVLFGHVLDGAPVFHR